MNPALDGGYLPMFMRENELCWAEVGNEQSREKEIFGAFEESVFYSSYKFFWNTQVPWRNNIWEGDVLLIIPEETPTSAFVAECKCQFRKFHNIKNRPLFNRTRQAIIDFGYLDDLETFVMIENDRLEESKFVKGVICTQLMRQYFLAKRTNELEQCIFCITRVVKKLPRACSRVIYPDVGHQLTFFRVTEGNI